jgi:hypothetical protein
MKGMNNEVDFKVPEAEKKAIGTHLYDSNMLINSPPTLTGVGHQ